METLEEQIDCGEISAYDTGLQVTLSDSALLKALNSDPLSAIQNELEDLIWPLSIISDLKDEFVKETTMYVVNTCVSQGTFPNNPKIPQGF